MSGSGRFWRNLGLIGLAHAALLGGLIHWSSDAKKPDATNVVWMGGAPDNDVSSSAKPTPVPKPVKVSTPPPDSNPPEEEESEQTILNATKSEIQMPASTPKPSPSVTPTSTPVPRESPKVKAPPKSPPKPKPSPKPTPKASPKKTVLAKLAPKPTPKAKATPEKKPADEDVDPEKKKEEKAEPEKKPNVEPADKAPKPVSAQPGKGKGSSSGGSGRGGGATIQAQFGWYGSMLHDRFYSEWAQPTSTAVNAKSSALVKIRIEKDGRISSFEIVRPSGDPAVDQSINAVAKRVTQVDPLPAGLGSGDHYDVKINFELNSE